MKLGIFVNTLRRPDPRATTYLLAAECLGAGHGVWLLSPNSLSYEPGDRLLARARTVDGEGIQSSEGLVRRLESPGSREEWIDVGTLDVLWLRNNPPAQTSWAGTAGIQLGRAAVAEGVLVLNDPEGLARAENKLYLLRLPAATRPHTLVTRDRDRIAAFLEQEGKIVLKPLQGYGGANVFVARAGDGNLDRMITAIGRDGYVVAQAYLPEAERGDLRLFMLNGLPMTARGRYAAAFRRRTGDDIRSNVHAGGEAVRGEVDERALRLAEAIRPLLVADGMFFVGVDIVGDKVMELNVFSPGGLGDAGRLEGVNFVRVMREAIEAKAEHAASLGRTFVNAELATH